MDCTEIQDLLYDYVTGHLDEKERDSMKSHLEMCDACKDKWAIMKKSLSLLDDWVHPTLPSNFAEKVLEKIHAQKKPFWEKFVEKLFFPMVIKIPLEGIAVAVLIFGIIMAYRGGTIPELEKTPRGIIIGTQVTDAKNPIIIETPDIQSAFARLIETIKANHGHLVRRKPIDAGIKVTLRIEKDKEKDLLKGLTQLGKVRRGKNGYKDKEGNIVVILK